MKNPRSVKNQKGQMAIFIVLIFQVLFIFFALSLNVAMVVHDKINLQNSLDLAAYYGAKKQAEVLNVMAHINYQMRQNWKLLAWRYRILGTLAQYNGYYQEVEGDKKYWCPQNSDKETDCSKVEKCSSDTSLYPSGYCDKAYFICINHDIWIRGIDPDSDKNLCTKAKIHIQPITPSPVSAGFMVEAHEAARGIRDLIRKISKSCPLEGSLNWLMAQLFITHFRLDQKDRKLMIEEIYNKTLKIGKDLDGASIDEGAKKVFKQNLTKANYNSFKGSKLIPFNSFKDRNKEFDDVFGKINVAPILQFIHVKRKDIREGNCNQDNRLHFEEKSSSSQTSLIYGFLETLQEESDWAKTFKDNEGFINSRFQYNKRGSLFNKEHHPMAELTLSFFKKLVDDKPKEILYYGLKVEFDYKAKYQIFSLIPKITFKATAFAKPFGGQFGPQPEQSDKLIPIYYYSKDNNKPEFGNKMPNNLDSPGSEYIYRAQPNYSRWPGDQWGLVDKRLHDNKDLLVFLNKHNNYGRNTRRVYNLEDYMAPVYKDIHDPLAKNTREPTTLSFSRMIELMAVYPDLYDITYYSIMANYHWTYFPRVCKLLKESDCNPKNVNAFPAKKAKENKMTAYIRGDFGWPYYESEIDSRREEELKRTISIAPFFYKAKEPEKEEIKGFESFFELPEYKYNEIHGLNNPPSRFGYNKNYNNPNFPKAGEKIFYPWLAKTLPNKILSSWTSPKSDLDYNHPTGYNQRVEPEFLNCHTPAAKERPVPSACVGMGRSGYSVKLISCDVIDHTWCYI